MKRVGILFLVLVALVAMTTADAVAQPKVTITGLVDNVSSWTNNMSVVDINPARTGDREWYARTRVRPDITAAVGTTKFVLGLEIDSTWGQTGATDTTAPNRSGTSSSWDINTDTLGVIEIKWAYTEFAMPIIPVPTVFRLGAQPWQAQYKLAALATGDFAGVHMTNQWAPMFKSNLTYAFIEESSTGPRDAFIRGEDFALVASVEITPFKGLDIRPIYSYANIIGVTGQPRLARGGLGTGAGVYQTCPGTAGPGTGACGVGSKSSVEDRHTIGVDARWRFGAFSLDPTFFFQFGSRDQIAPTVSATSGPSVHSTLSREAYFFDIRGGWQAGPLLVEGAFIYTSGNEADERIDLNRDKIRYYEAISTDTSYYATWAEIWALGIDYFNIIRSGSPGMNPGVAIGYDKYGLMRIGARASYALTPAFTVRTGATANWTAEDVDTRGTHAAATGITPRCTAAQLDAAVPTCVDSGTASYLGTELNLGFQWRFVPNVALDVVGSYMFAGNALATHVTTSNTGAVRNGRNPQDIQAITARVRYTW
ncbi:MAG: hypothetical protein FJ027_19785 [Candidatus Rokubacteria bacterium]|nr:hypothetical protein [Candidatus Rokubacteria bacterium]